MNDLRLATRMVARKPGMAALAVTALALGIGLTTTMFSIVNGAVFRGLPFPESDRILHVAPFDLAEQDDTGARAHTVAELSRRQRSFEELAAFYRATANVVGADGIPERYRGAWVTTNTFRMLRMAPLLGRDFRDEEGRPGAPAVVVIGHRLWQERFGGQADAIGRPLRVNGAVSTVIGVMPDRFRFPYQEDLWSVAPIEPNVARSHDEQTYEIIGRLRPGSSKDQASAEMATLWDQLVAEFGDRYEKGFTIEVKTYVEEFLGTDAVRALLTMLVAVTGVLLIACVNVANLVLARAADRTRELAIRAALGASRWRVVRQLLVEVLLLAAIGAAGGLALAQAGVRLFSRAIVDTNPPFWLDIRIDQASLQFVTAAALLATVVAGLAPALRASRQELWAIMNDEGRSTGLRVGRFSRGLVVAELALSFGLLVVSGLVIRSLVVAGRADFGFATAEVWMGRLVLPEQEYGSDDQKRHFAQALLGRLQVLPGVTSAALTTVPPPGAPRQAIKFPGKVPADERSYPEARGVTVSPDYFRVLRVGVLRGRGLLDQDREGALPVAVVNESFARKHFPEGALGQTFALARGDHQEWRTIVGLVPDLGMGAMSQGRVPEAFYLPLAQVPRSGVSLLLQTSGAPLQVTAGVRQAVRDIDSNLPVFDVNTLERALHEAFWEFRVFGTLFSAFGLAALFLATVGLYGVMAFSVGQRTQEFGVRMAMGASRRDVSSLVLGQGLIQIGSGIAIGVGLGAALSSAMTALLFQVSPFDPVMFVSIAALLTATGLAACLVPARRASGVDPMVALRGR